MKKIVSALFIVPFFSFPLVLQAEESVPLDSERSVRLDRVLASLTEESVPLAPLSPEEPESISITNPLERQQQRQLLQLRLQEQEQLYEQMQEQLQERLQLLRLQRQLPASAADAPPPVREGERRAVNPDNSPSPQEQARLDFQQAMQRVQHVLEEAQIDPPIRQELTRALQYLMIAAQRFHRTVAASNPLSPEPTPQPPSPPSRERPALDTFDPAIGRQAAQPQPAGFPRNTNQLTAEREKAYIELARQYFYVFSSTPPEPPVTLRSLTEQMAAAPIPYTENGETAEIEAPLDPKEEWTRKREEILENFVECVQKISPAARISLITELIRSAHTNEELKLLEDLLDEMLQPGR